MDETSVPGAGQARLRPCPGCGAPNPGGAAFCLRCGTTLRAPTTQFVPIVAGVGEGQPASAVHAVPDQEPIAAHQEVGPTEHGAQAQQDVSPVHQGAPGQQAAAPSEEAGPDCQEAGADGMARPGHPGPVTRAASERVPSATAASGQAPVEGGSAEVAGDRGPVGGDRPKMGRGAVANGLSVTLLGATPLAVVTMDVEGRITILNAAAERLFSTSSREAVGRPYPEVFGPSLSKRMLALFMLVARSGDHRNAQTFQVSLPDGRRAGLRASAGPLRDADGGPIGIFFVAEDQGALAVAAGTPEQRSGEGQLRTSRRRDQGDGSAAQIDRPSLLGVGGVRQTISVLHAEMRGDAALVEAREPEQVAEVLQRYRDAAVAALESEGATIDCESGDAIMALWNAPEPQVGHAGMAIRGALALRAAALAVGSDVHFGIGVHSGEAVVGTLGGGHSMHYTAMGEAVTIAARLQSAAPSGGIICSAAVLNAAGRGIRAAPLGALQIDGRKDVVDAYAVKGLDP